MTRWPNCRPPPAMLFIVPDPFFTSQWDFFKVSLAHCSHNQPLSIFKISILRCNRKHIYKQLESQPYNVTMLISIGSTPLLLTKAKTSCDVVWCSWLLYSSPFDLTVWKCEKLVINIELWASQTMGRQFRRLAGKAIVHACETDLTITGEAGDILATLPATPVGEPSDQLAINEWQHILHCESYAPIWPGNIWHSSRLVLGHQYIEVE